MAKKKTYHTSSLNPQRKRERDKLFRKEFDQKACHKLILNSSSKSQSAMEYLMTYGWAILIIAIVMVAMFSLGIFNPLTFAPRAQPGACQVFRSVVGTNLEGQCNNEIPEYAAKFGGAFSGTYITAFPPSGLSGATGLTVSAWVYDFGSDGQNQGVISDCAADCGTSTAGGFSLMNLPSPSIQITDANGEFLAFTSMERFLQVER